MKEWRTYKIGDICKRVCSGGTPKSTEQSYYNGDIPWLNTKEINFNRISSTEKSITQYGLDNSSAKWIDKDSVIVAMYGATAAKVAINTIPLTTNQACCNLSIDENIADYRFVYFWLCANYASLASLANGGAQQNLNAQQIKDFEINLPDLATQQKIADVLWSIDDKINCNCAINDNLEQQAQALFEEWLGKTPTTKGVFNDIIKTTIVGDWGQENKQGNYTHEVFCIRGADIPTLRNGDKGKMPIRYILEKNYKTKQLQANDIVVEISGGSPTQSTGRVCMVTRSLLERLGKDLVCTNFCRAITPKDNYAIFIFLYWQMLYNKNTMFSYENGTTGIKNFNIADFISKEEIDVPSSNDVEKLNKILQPMYDQIYANGLQNETLATLRDTLLPKLMSGEISVDDVSID